MDKFFLVEPTTCRVSQWFGKNPQIYKQFGMSGHNGTDHATPIGTSITAMQEGKITVKKYSNSGYGYHIKQWIEGYGELIYAHLSEITVKQGDWVKIGQEIGKSGNTGFSTGPHLHTGYRPMGYDNNNGYFGWVDPKPYLISKKSYMTIFDRFDDLEQRIKDLDVKYSKEIGRLKSKLKVEKKDRRKNDKLLKARKWGADRVKKYLKK